MRINKSVILSVDRDSSILFSVRLRQANNNVTEFPPSESLNRYVSFESRYGTWLLPVSGFISALISSATSERVWKVFSFIHSKRRNRRGNSKVEKLAYIYANSALLDQKDKQGYFDCDLGVSDNDETDHE